MALLDIYDNYYLSPFLGFRHGTATYVLKEESARDTGEEQGGYEVQYGNCIATNNQVSITEVVHSQAANISTIVVA